MDEQGAVLLADLRAKEAGCTWANLPPAGSGCDDLAHREEAPSIRCNTLWDRSDSRVSVPPPRFFVSVADKGLSVVVSGLESTLAGLVCKC
jgi:hypothetical protein